MELIYIFIAFNNHNNRDYELKLNTLLKDVFFDFQFWYELNLWDDKYESYSVIENDKIVSNICVFKTQILYRNKQYPALSIGAVATQKEYRGRGFSRALMEHIINKYDGTPMYLSANEDVIDFYPRFGFTRIYEKLPVCLCDINNEIKPNKLAYDDPKVWKYVYNRVNFSKSLDCLNTASINMFHIYSGYLKEHIYELPDKSTMLTAIQNGPVLKLIGVFSLKNISFEALIDSLPFTGVKRIEFGFMPHWSDISFTMQEYETDPLFVRSLSCDLGAFKFPELSVT